MRHGKGCYDAVANRKGQDIGISVDPDGKVLGTHKKDREEYILVKRQGLILAVAMVVILDCDSISNSF